MKEFVAESLITPLAEMIEQSLVFVEKDTCNALKDAEEKESSLLCKWALSEISKNNEIAASSNSYACQDCGQAVLFVSVGQDMHICGDLTKALNSGVEKGYKFARKSVADPLTRLNTNTNTPAIIHYNIVLGDKLEISYLAKGAGSENMSKIYMLTPALGEKGIIDSVLDCVVSGGANPCPPIIIGVGIGGTLEKCAILSKQALLRQTGKSSTDKNVAVLEYKILKEVNKTGIGAQGFGGDITALAVHIETAPTHIGMLPVAVNIQCHSVRHGRIVF